MLSQDAIADSATMSRLGRVPHVGLILIAVALGVVAVVLRLSLAAQNVDDAYITYRYAHNLASGHGLVFNPGQAVLGTTSPLWAATLAGGERLGVAPDRAGPDLAAVAGGIVTALVVLLAGSLGAARGEAFLAGLLWATDPLSIRVERGGMEASPFTALALATLLAAGTGSERRTTRVLVGFSAALATLMRPEGVLVVIVAIAARMFHRRSPGLEVLAVAAVLVPWMTFATVVYGSPIPHSVIAKATLYAGGTSAATVMAFCRDAALFLSHVVVTPGPITLALAALAGIALLWAAFARPARRGAAAAAFAIAYLSAYIVAAPELFLWYHVPFGPVVVASTAAMLSWLIRRVFVRRSARFLARGAVAVAAVTAVTGGATLFAPADGHAVEVKIEVSEREPRYFEAARLLKRLGVEPPMRVAAPEIGALGYALPRMTIVDTAGLVSPEAMPFIRAGGGGSPSPRLFLALRPEVVVLPDAFAGAVLADPRFGATYLEVARVAGSVRLGPAIHIFARRDVLGR